MPNFCCRMRLPRLLVPPTSLVLAPRASSCSAPMSHPERDVQRATHRGHSVYTEDPFPDHPPNHPAHEEHHHRRRIPALPDLRFEYSYLRGVRSFVRVERLEPLRTDEKGKGVALPEEVGSEETQQLTRREILHVQWGNIVWATLRDQVISPFLQGALWCVQSRLQSLPLLSAAMVGAGVLPACLYSRYAVCF